MKFANIEEDTPSYHRSYDFFVSRFSEMCHSSFEDPDIRTKWALYSSNGHIIIKHCVFSFLADVFQWKIRP